MSDPVNTASGSTDDLKAISRVRQLVSLASDRALEPAEQAELSAILEQRRELVPEYVACVSTEAMLEVNCGVSFLDPPALAPTLPATPDRPAPHPVAQRAAERSWRALRAWAPSLALATGLLVVVGVATNWWGSRFGTVVAVRDAEWGVGRCDVGAAIDDGWRELESGSVQLVTRRGAMIAVDAPARFRLTGWNRCELRYGAITAQVGEGAQGLRVDGPFASAIDLGTGFRMSVAQSGEAILHVTEGSVELVREEDGQSLSIEAGEIGRVTADRITSSTERHLKTSGSVDFQPIHLKRLGDQSLSADGRLAVFLESCHRRLPHDVVLNLVRPGKHRNLDGVQGAATEGTIVDTYLIHSSPRRRRHIVTGSITFPSEVIGVICGDDRLSATNDVLGSAWSLRCEHPERGLESAPDPNSDLVTISPDRRTVTVAIRTESIDQLRVLVAGE